MPGAGLEQSPAPRRRFLGGTSTSELLVQIIEIGPTNAASDFGQMEQNVVRQFAFQLIGNVSLKRRAVGARESLPPPNCPDCVQAGDILASQLDQSLTEICVFPHRLLDFGRSRGLKLFVQKCDQLRVGKSVGRRRGISGQRRLQMCEKIKWTDVDRQNQTSRYGSVFSKLGWKDTL